MREAYSLSFAVRLAQGRSSRQPVREVEEDPEAVVMVAAMRRRADESIGSMVEEQQVNSVIWIAKAAGLWLISALFPPLELGVVLEQIRARFSEKDVARGVTKRERERSTFRLGIGITLCKSITVAILREACTNTLC